ncbi:MAG TPA: CDP-alcohol phosphatidyltransferase family protein [Myxococcota bacterium]|nr:CDP-alcohol phosphatidyltransferase family protein [Myxococcota bacterium]
MTAGTAKLDTKGAAKLEARGPVARSDPPPAAPSGPSSGAASSGPAASRAADRPRAWILPAGAAAPRLFGLTGEARLSRSLDRVGVAVASVGSESPARAADGTTVVLSAAWVYDERLVAALCDTVPCWLAARDGTLVAAHVADAECAGAARALAAPSPHTPEGVAGAVGPDALVPPYSHELRKREAALLEPLVPDARERLERRLFDASYKGITDLVTKYVWPPLALPAVRACARLGITPNVVTVASWVLVFVAGVCFAEARFGAGLAAAWLMTFLDTVDGKLARVTLRTSRIGHVLDHGLDILHPPFWWAAFGLALAAPWATAATWVAFVGYWLHRGVEGLFLAVFGIEIHAWRRLDARFRLVTTRRNPNLILLTLGWAAGRPDLGFAALALWTVASILFHLVRIAQAGVERLRGHPIRSEYEIGGLEAAGAGPGR